MSPTVRRRRDGFEIKMYFDEHDPPHVHVVAKNFVASLSIKDQSVLEFRGRIVARLLRVASAWVAEHKDESLRMWERQLEPGGIYTIE